jgi:hypothetical protein
LTGKPVVTVDYIAELNRIVRPAADETQNAAPLYHKAAALYEKVPQDISKLLGKKYRDATAEEKQLIEKWIAENSEALDLIVAGTQKPYYWRTYANKENTGEMIAMLFPHLSGFRELARALRWRIWLSAEQSRYQAAFDDIKTCYRFGQHIRRDKTLVEQLTGIAIEAMSIQALSDILSEHRIDSAKLAVLQQSFEKMIVNKDFRLSLKTEKMFMYDEIQRCFTEDRFGGGHLYLSRIRAISSNSQESAHTAGELLVENIFFPRQWSRAVRVLFFHPDKQQTREMADRLYAFWDKIAQKTPAQVRAEGIDIEKETTDIIKGNVLLEILTPALGRINEMSYQIQVKLGATVAILAALRYKQNMGNYPEDLNELIAADYLKELPIDPFSDKPLVYKKTDDSFVLYSLGPDFDDDGGVENPKDSQKRRQEGPGDAVFWPMPKLQLKQ